MILFENTHVLAVDKRPGFLSVLSRLGEKDPRPCEFLEWKKIKKQSLWSVHRLDEEVSGILLLAKDPKSHSLLSQAFEGRELAKTYEAISENPEGKIPPSKEERWESFLLRGKKRAYEKPFGKKAITLAQFAKEVEVSKQKLLYWRLFPLTGRSHQLRFELFKRGFPIWGDSLYGGKLPFPLNNALALRAVGLDFSKVKAREALDLPMKIEASSLHDWLKSVNAD